MRSLTRAVLIALLVALAVPPLHGASNGTIAPFPKHQFFDNNGDPCNACQMFTYTAGTSTKVNTYTDAALGVANTNPIVLDSAGRATIFLTPGVSYKFVLAPSTDTDPPAAPIWTIDNVSAVPPASTSADVDVTVTAGETLAAGDAVYESDGSGGLTAGRWYKTDADNTYSSTTALVVGFANAAISTGSTGTVRRIGRVTGLTSLVAGTTYYVSATAGALTAVAPTNVRVIAMADTTTSVMVIPGHPIASATVPGIVGLLSQTLGSGATTDVKTVGGIAVNSTPNYKSGSDPALNSFSCAVLRGNVDTTQHANSGTGNTVMSSFALGTGALGTNGQFLRITIGGTFAANANNKTVTFLFGATILTVFTGAPNGGNWHAVIEVIRTGAATQKIIGFGIDRPGGIGDPFGYSTTSAETLANSITVQTKSQSGTASSDILQEVFIPEICG